MTDSRRNAGTGYPRGPAPLTSLAWFHAIADYAVAAVLAVSLITHYQYSPKRVTASTRQPEPV